MLISHLHRLYVLDIWHNGPANTLDARKEMISQNSTPKGVKGIRIKN